MIFRNIILLLSFWSVNALAAPSVTVAVIDTPLDYSNQHISGVVDRFTLQNSYVFSPDLQSSISWWDFNNTLLKSLSAQMHSDPQGFWRSVEFSQLQDLAKRGGFNGLPKPLLEGMLSRVFAHAFARTQPVQDFSLFHGTHVAGLMTHNLQGVELLNFMMPLPIIRSGASSDDTLRNFAQWNRLYFSAISEAFKKKRVRVVNLSLGYEISAVTIALQNALNTRTLPLSQAREVTPQKLQNIFYNEFENFVDQNSEVVFVFAAGNEGKNVEQENHDLIKLKRNNTVFVAAYDTQTMQLADFSNYGPQKIDIAANGVNLLSAAAGSPRHGIWMSGTSMAAPLVSKRLTQILLNDQDLAPQSAIEVLYESWSSQKSGLKNSVKDGRLLIAQDEDEFRPVTLACATSFN